MREEKMLEKAVVFDIDGTLCDDTSRRKEYLTKGIGKTTYWIAKTADRLNAHEFSWITIFTKDLKLFSSQADLKP